MFLNIFVNLIGKHTCSLPNTVACLQACNFIKKWLQHRRLLLKFAKFLRTPVFKNICERLLLSVAELEKAQRWSPVHSFSGSHFFLWKPLYGVRHSAYWNNRTISLLIVYTRPLSAVIKGGFLKIFDYEHEHEKWRTTSINR